MTSSGRREHGGLLQQPRAVWAVAFAAVIAFMGIGLVDPILPAIAKDLQATPSQVELLFTSYMLVTGVAMLMTGAVSSRIGPKRTLLGGLALIVVFSALAGSSGTINQIVGFRAGWGLGNALFIATALATIVGAASGGVAGSIILYEAALGIGIATGPLLGGLLGGISWRGPFFGTATLMAVGFIAIAAMLPASPKPDHRTSIADPIRALRHRGLLTTGLTALFYNFGFFTLLAYTPFPLRLGAHGLGLVFFGWGVGLAITSVFVAPRLQSRFGTIRTMYAVLLGLAAVLAVMGVFTAHRGALIVCVVVAGLLLGVNNTLITEAVMKVSPVERPVASAGYSFVRFIGGAIAPYLAGKLAEWYTPHIPFFVGAAATVVAVLVLATGRRHLSTVDGRAGAAPSAREVVLLAVDASDAAEMVTAAAAGLATDRGLQVEVLHVRETDIVGEETVDVETMADAHAALECRLEQLRRAGVPCAGAVAPSMGNHAHVARVILDQAARSGAAAIVVGASGRDGLAHLLEGSVVRELNAHANCPVLVVDPAGRSLVAAESTDAHDAA